MKRLLLGLGFALFAAGANAQQALVVSTCGTMSTPYLAGRQAPVTVDTTGVLCSTTSGGGAETDVNVSEVGGNATAVGAGVVTTGTQRTTLASDDPAVTRLTTIAGAVAGTEMQVDVLTLPAITGTVTANAGTNLNTSLLALESGGNLSTLVTQMAILSGAVSGTEMQVDVLSLPAITGTVAATQSGAWTVTANAGTDLNTSLLALESGGNLAAAATSLALLDNTVGTVAPGTAATATELSGALYNATPPSPTDGQGLALQTDSRGNLKVVLASVNSASFNRMLANNADDIAVTASAQNIASIGYMYGFDGTTWDRMPGTSADGLLVNLGANNDVTVTGTVAVTQSGAWTVTANAGTNLNTSALALESGGNLAAVATSVAILDDWDETDRAKVNLIVGQAGIAAGAGAVGVTVPRVTLASDDPAVVALQIMDDWDETDRAKVNIIAGQAGITAGAGAVAANTPRVTHASDDPVTTAVQLIDNAVGTVAAGTAAANAFAVGGIYNSSLPAPTNGQGMALQLSNEGTLLVREQPTSQSTAAITPSVSSAVEANRVAKASAGNLYSFQVTTGATAGYVLIYNATSAPADGAVTPIKCYQISANATLGATFDPPIAFSTGITIGFSTTGCFTKTASTTAFISAEVK